MSIQITVEVKVYCNGGFHPPLEMRLPQRSTFQSEIKTNLRHRGWKIVGTGEDAKTYCPDHHPEKRKP